MSHLAGIFGCGGVRLTDDERAFFRDVRPWGFILFARNIEDADQTRALIDSLREAARDEAAPVFVDQEGGRVQRLKPPLARLRRPAEAFGALYARDPQAAAEAVRLNHRLIAHELMAFGFDADCAPCLDLRLPETHAVIGDRAFGRQPAEVGMLGRAALDGLLAGGVAPVIKHIPGHGRARVDSHLDLPVVATPLEVLEAADFAPFRALADAPMAMTAHVVFSAIDPEACVTLSHRAIGAVIRGSIGFDGLLMSDDLSMKALGGSFEERTRRALDAGCDVVLHCNGDMAEMRAVAGAAQPLHGRAAERAAAARSLARRVQPFDAEAAQTHLDSLGLGRRVGPMSAAPFQQQFDFEAAGVAAEDGEALIVDLDGYEGPLHVLLALARSQKVDLLKLSILKLAEQYLVFVHQARRLRFSLAADYLVMAAWLAYLKSRLLLPKPEPKLAEEPPAEALAQGLAFRLAKLDVMRKAVEALRERPQLGRDVFVRGDPQAVRIVSSSHLEGDLYALMRAYADQRKTHAARHYRPATPQAYPLEDARNRLRHLLPGLKTWRTLAGVAPERGGQGGPSRASYLASTLSASLELVKEGALETRQLEPFAELYLRARLRLDGAA